MALLLENLASHYDQMASALKDSEAGDTFNQDDLQGIVELRLSAALSKIVFRYES